MADIPSLQLQIRIMPLLGSGKIQVLEAIDRHGSISAAARVLGMGYPNAWKIVDGLNQHFREPLVVRVHGGQRGGGASLTDTGRTVLNIFRSMEAKARVLFASDLDTLRLLLAEPQAGETCPPQDSTPDGPDCRQGRNRQTALAS
jgi:molybdate transport system regulatory protein